MDRHLSCRQFGGRPAHFFPHKSARRRPIDEGGQTYLARRSRICQPLLLRVLRSNALQRRAADARPRRQRLLIETK